MSLRHPVDSTLRVPNKTATLFLYEQQEKQFSLYSCDISKNMNISQSIFVLVARLYVSYEDAAG